jgi:hypothetical protein
MRAHRIFEPNVHRNDVPALVMSDGEGAEARVLGRSEDIVGHGG